MDRATTSTWRRQIRKASCRTGVQTCALPICQNRRHQAGTGVSRATRAERDQPDADQSVWTGRQLRLGVVRSEKRLVGLEFRRVLFRSAKIAGIKLAQAYRAQHGLNAISLMPTNLYGPGDNFDLASSHVLPALIRKTHEALRAGAPEITVWGSGTPRREFLHVDDLADAAVFLMLAYDSGEIINVGSGIDVTIRELAEMIGHAAGYTGSIAFDSSKPDGTPRKLLDVSRLTALGWKPKIALADGIAETWRWYIENVAARG